MLGEYTKEDGKKLLELARQAIEEQFFGKKPEILDELKEKQFKQARGVFVTLHKNKELRGCIGFPMPIMAITEAVMKAAKASAFSDYRFKKLKQEELQDIKIELSILTIPQDCKPNEITIGKDGLICEYLGYSGLLLPQVATEYKMNRIEFLEVLCNKAGLPNDTWQNKNFKLKKFQCQIFKED